MEKELAIFTSDLEVVLIVSQIKSTGKVSKFFGKDTNQMSRVYLACLVTKIEWIITVRKRLDADNFPDIIKHKNGLPITERLEVCSEGD